MERSWRLPQGLPNHDPEEFFTRTHFSDAVVVFVPQQVFPSDGPARPVLQFDDGSPIQSCPASVTTTPVGPTVQSVPKSYGG